MAGQGNSRVIYLENGQYVGQREQYSCGYSEASGSYSAHWPNTAYFCSHCGDIWLRAIYEHKFEYKPIPQSIWAIESRRCVKHGDGTVLAGLDLDGCSEELLRRELLALLQQVKE
jgi:hypothetical protein